MIVRGFCSLDRIETKRRRRAMGKKENAKGSRIIMYKYIVEMRAGEQEEENKGKRKIWQMIRCPFTLRRTTGLVARFFSFVCIHALFFSDGPTAEIRRI